MNNKTQRYSRGDVRGVLGLAALILGLVMPSNSAASDRGGGLFETIEMTIGEAEIHGFELESFSFGVSANGHKLAGGTVPVRGRGTALEIESRISAELLAAVLKGTPDIEITVEIQGFSAVGPNGSPDTGSASGNVRGTLGIVLAGGDDTNDVPYDIALWHAGWKIVEKKEKDDIVTGYVFADPIVTTRRVKIEAGKEETLDFELVE